MPTKTSYTKKSIYFKLVVGNKHKKSIRPISKVYNGEDEIDASKLKAFFNNVFESCSTQLNDKNIISNDILETIKEDYSKNKCSTFFFIQEHKDGPCKEYALFTNSFTHCTNQMIDNGMDIRFYHRRIKR
eukprot:2938078-Ditylum_brightwellii.AAC.1